MQLFPPQIHLERRGSPAHVHDHGGLPSQAESVSRLVVFCKWNTKMHSADSSSARLISPRFTCDECVAGMEWIEAYLEDPIFQVIFFLMKFWLSVSCFCQKVVSVLSTSFNSGGGTSLPRAQLVRPTSPRRTLHWDAAAPLHPDARDGDGEVHDPHGHLQQPVRSLQPRLDHRASDPPTSLYSPTSNTSSHVNLEINYACMIIYYTIDAPPKSTYFVFILPSS